MFIKRTTKHVKGKPYHNHLLVESVQTPKGPRHRVICSLGRLDPGPPEQWLALARRIEAALAGQTSLYSEKPVEELIVKVRSHSAQPRSGVGPEEEAAPHVVGVLTDGVRTEQVREAGPVHVGHEMWKRLELDAILAKAGLTARARLLTEVMVMSRLVRPCSELAMPDWLRRTALTDILGEDFTVLFEDSLYRNLDRLHPRRESIEKQLADRERTLFNLEDSIYLYDLTSTYFEGQCKRNPQAKRGYSRDNRPDCKQVVVGLVLGREGFPKAHEVFEGSRRDAQSLEGMLTALEKRTGKQTGKTVVVDRGMAYPENLRQIQSHGHHYLVASRQGERNEHLDDFEEEQGWGEILRESSPRNPGQKKSRVFIKRSKVGEETHILCRSEGREEKDRAIREKQEARLLRDLAKLEKRVNEGRLVAEAKIHQAIGRLKERYPRVARYYRMDYDAEMKVLSWQEDKERKDRAKLFDGGYVLKTDRTDLSEDEIWRMYMLLTRIESAFRSMKSPLLERPIFHHREDRVQTHIFLCVLAYHLLVAIENRFLAQGVHTSWATLRQALSTHQVVTVVLPTQDGRALRIRRSSTPEKQHREIYGVLGIPEEVMEPVKTWGEL
ncbi:MAG: IS1634 family transposase [Deltaproteobacteria bacterium]|nr:IS1634 family transposase [Deltaproteobacteria bacterium]